MGSTFEKCRDPSYLHSLAMGIPLAYYRFMLINDSYDVAITGGGLAGLAAAILLREMGHSVVLFEKEKYPFHKVCGEYVSKESWPFLCSLGLPLPQMELPLINRFLLSAPDGRTFHAPLQQGGFGISRYMLDHLLAEKAKLCGVQVLEETKVEEINREKGFEIRYQSAKHGNGETVSRVAFVSYGKRSNLDVKWKREFLNGKKERLDNYVGIKYHVTGEWDRDQISLHNFEDGYCGMSAVEDDRYCLCYMTRAANLKKAGNDIAALQEKVLFKNPHLKKLFSEAQFIEGFPVTISQISFMKKEPVEKGMLFLGDAAGMIAPLCGNGMSIALHTAKLAAGLADQYLQNKISKEELEASYQRQWKKNFSTRLQRGRMIQSFFGSSVLSNFFVQTFRSLPFLARPVIRMTHGEPF